MTEQEMEFIFTFIRNSINNDECSSVESSTILCEGMGPSVVDIMFCI